MAKLVTENKRMEKLQLDGADTVAELQKQLDDKEVEVVKLVTENKRVERAQLDGAAAVSELQKELDGKKAEVAKLVSEKKNLESYTKKTSLKIITY